MLFRTALLYIALGNAAQYAWSQQVHEVPPSGSACVELSRITEGRESVQFQFR
jgi:hypothetical protein